MGTLVSFSTQPGNVALDGQGRNSPYSGPLAKAIGTPGEDILSILTAVRNEVLTATGQKQVPWENHALTAKFYFNPSAATQPPALAGEAAQAWIAVQGTTSEAVLEEYTRRFPDSVYAGFAKARLGELKSKSESSWWHWPSGKSAEAEKPQEAQTNAGQTKPALAPKDTQVAVAAPPARRDPARTGVRRAARGRSAAEHAALHQAGLGRELQGLPGLPGDGDRAGGQLHDGLAGERAGAPTATKARSTK